VSDRRRFSANNRRLGDGSVAFVQEGGYQPSHLAYATLGVLERALGSETGIEDPLAWLDEDFSMIRPRLDEVVDAHREHWPVE
jgi:hypothetical protein